MSHIGGYLEMLHTDGSSDDGFDIVQFNYFSIGGGVKITDEKSSHAWGRRLYYRATLICRLLFGIVIEHLWMNN